MRTLTNITLSDVDSGPPARRECSGGGWGGTRTRHAEVLERSRFDGAQRRIYQKLRRAPLSVAEISRMREEIFTEVDLKRYAANFSEYKSDLSPKVQELLAYHRSP